MFNQTWDCLFAVLYNVVIGDIVDDFPFEWQASYILQSFARISVSLAAQKRRAPCMQDGQYHFHGANQAGTR